MEVIKHQTCPVASRIQKQCSMASTTSDERVRLPVRFRNGTVQWSQVDDVNLQDPFPIVQHAKRNHLEKPPSFVWVEKIIKDNDRLVDLAHVFKTKVEQGPRCKFGVEAARSPRRAGLQMDKANGNHLWKDASATEQKQINACNSFQEPTACDNLSKHELILRHMVCDVKFNMREKARLVMAGGNWTVTHKEGICSGIMSTHATHSKNQLLMTTCPSTS
jgi:hypothetical protein